MNFVDSTNTESSKKCLICCLPLREATRTGFGHWTCKECTMWYRLRYEIGISACSNCSRVLTLEMTAA